MRRTATFFLLSACATGLASCSDYEVIKHEGDDVFYQLEAGEVDVLLMVDNSCSMAPYQAKLAENFEAFLTFFVEGDVDYHIGVVTTTVTDPVAGNGCSEGQVASIPEAGHLVDATFIDPGTENGGELFSDLVSVGTCGSGFEMGLESAYRAVSPEQAQVNAGFLRDDAYLSIIFVSDEQDSSPLGVDEYINGFREVKGQRERDIFNASSLVVTDVEECTSAQRASGAAEGSRYVNVAGSTSGIIDSICGDDFESIVTELSLASSRLTDTFYLSQHPDASTLIVGVDEVEVPCESGEWSYQMLEEDGGLRPAIVFERTSMPPPQTRITVKYDLGEGAPEEFCGGGASADTGRK